MYSYPVCIAHLHSQKSELLISTWKWPLWKASEEKKKIEWTMVQYSAGPSWKILEKVILSWIRFMSLISGAFSFVTLERNFFFSWQLHSLYPVRWYSIGSCRKPLEQLHIRSMSSKSRMCLWRHSSSYLYTLSTVSLSVLWTSNYLNWTQDTQIHLELRYSNTRLCFSGSNPVQETSVCTCTRSPSKRRYCPVSVYIPWLRYLTSIPPFWHTYVEILYRKVI